MLDRDLARLYRVPNKALNQAVKRNARRFPEDFMFQLNAEEFEKWKSQIVTSKNDKQGLRKKPHAFTENGIAMLSSVLKSERAIMVNIEIMRTFTRIREMAGDQKLIHERLNKHEVKLLRHDQEIAGVFKVLDEMRESSRPSEKRKIGFLPPERDV